MTKYTRESAARAIAIARKGASAREQVESADFGVSFLNSATVGYCDAVSQFEQGNYRAAQRRAMTSIAYSYGMLSNEYKRAASTEV
jgi:hypothetical protein